MFMGIVTNLLLQYVQETKKDFIPGFESKIDVFFSRSLPVHLFSWEITRDQKATDKGSSVNWQVTAKQGLAKLQVISKCTKDILSFN